MKPISRNSRFSQQVTPNYINFDLPGINLAGANFTPLDDTIANLNRAGWDVKIVGYYSLAEKTNQSEYDTLLTQIRKDKQIIVKIRFDITNTVKIEVELKNSQLNESTQALYKSFIQSYLQKASSNFSSIHVIKTMAEGLGLILNPILSAIDVGEDGNGNRTTGDKLPRVVLSEDGYYLTGFGLPLWLPRGTIATFWPASTCAMLNDTCISGTTKNNRGMLAYIEFIGGGEGYISMYKKDTNGDLLRALRDSKGNAFAGVAENTVGISTRPRANINDIVTVLLGLSPSDGSCGAVEFVKARLTVKHEKKYGTYQGDYLGIDQLILEGLSQTKDLSTGQTTLTPNGSITPYTAIPDCPPVTTSAQLLDVLQNQADWFAIIDSEKKFNLSYYGIPYLITFKTPGNGFLLYRMQTKTWYEKGKNTNTWVEITISDPNLSSKVEEFVEKKVTSLNRYEVGKTAVFIALGFATGGLSSTVGILAAEVGLAATEAGVIYYIEQDATSAVITLVTGGIGSGVGIMAGRALSKSADDVLKNTVDEVLPAQTSLTLKMTRAAAKTSSALRDAIIKIEGGFVKMSVVRDYAKNVLKYTDDQIKYLADDIIEFSAKGNQSSLLNCAGFNNLGMERGKYVRSSTTPCFIKAWEKILEAAKKANPNLPDAGKILRTDIPSLTALSRFDNTLISKIGVSRFDNFLKNLIKANPKCSSCGNLGDALVGKLDDVLDDFHTVVTQRVAKADGSFVTGFDNFMAEAGEQATKAKAAALTLKKMSRHWDELTESGAYKLKNFEGSIPDIETGHQVDLLFTKTVNGVEVNKSIEMKNWSAARSVTGSTYDQFKAHVISGTNFEYYFSDGTQAGMKTSFQNLFKDVNKVSELFGAKRDFFIKLTNDVGITESEIVQMANDGDLIALINWVK